MVRKLDAGDVLYAYSLMQKGATRADAARAINVSLSAFRRNLHRLGLFTPIDTRAKFPRDAAVADYLSGMSELAVSQKYRVDRCVIHRELTKRGIKCRTGSEANYIRLSKMTPEERQMLVARAHEARRGTKDLHATLVKKALIKEAKTCFFGPGEDEFYDLLCAAGLEPVRQKAVDIYNVDFMLRGAIAVELTVGTSKFQGRCTNERERIKKLIECGCTVVTVSAKDIECLAFSYDKIISDLQQICANPTPSCKYWMIRCRSQNTETIRSDTGQWAAVKVPIKFFYTLREGKL